MTCRSAASRESGPSLNIPDVRYCSYLRKSSLWRRPTAALKRQNDNRRRSHIQRNHEIGERSVRCLPNLASQSVSQTRPSVKPELHGECRDVKPILQEQAIAKKHSK